MMWGVQRRLSPEKRKERQAVEVCQVGKPTPSDGRKIEEGKGQNGIYVRRYGGGTAPWVAVQRENQCIDA